MLVVDEAHLLNHQLVRCLARQHRHIGNSSDDRKVQENAMPPPRTTRNPIQMRSHDCDHPASACALRIDPERTPPRFDQRISAVSGINVLVIVGSRARTLVPN